tara:strand:+ start:818 stop:967 length:150 start_codon:yes stop_codon:yes gene_type:complete
MRKNLPEIIKLSDNLKPKAMTHRSTTSAQLGVRKGKRRNLKVGSKLILN